MVNKVILVGNAGNDPEIKDFNGTNYATLSLATSENYKDKNGQKVEKTEWHNLVFWRGLAEVVEKWVKKGSKLYVEGSIKTTTSEKAGVKKYYTSIQVKEMKMLGGGKTENSTQQSAPKPAVQNTEKKEDPDTTLEPQEDDLPF